MNLSSLLVLYFYEVVMKVLSDSQPTCNFHQQVALQKKIFLCFFFAFSLKFLFVKFVFISLVDCCLFLLTTLVLNSCLHAYMSICSLITLFSVRPLCTPFFLYISIHWPFLSIVISSLLCNESALNAYECSAFLGAAQLTQRSDIILGSTLIRLSQILLFQKPLRDLSLIIHTHTHLHKICMHTYIHTRQLLSPCLSVVIDPGTITYTWQSSLPGFIAEQLMHSLTHIN